MSIGFINPAIYGLHNQSGAIDDIRPGGQQGMFRRDFTSTYVTNAKGFVSRFREIPPRGDHLM